MSSLVGRIRSGKSTSASVRREGSFDFVQSPTNKKGEGPILWPQLAPAQDALKGTRRLFSAFADDRRARTWGNIIVNFANHGLPCSLAHSSRSERSWNRRILSTLASTESSGGAIHTILRLETKLRAWRAYLNSRCTCRNLHCIGPEDLPECTMYLPHR